MIASITQIIKTSDWWQRAAICPDRHYHPSLGIMLTDHLEAVTQLVYQLFANTENRFLQGVFVLLEQLGLSKQQVAEDLIITALLHDIGKTEDDKSQWVIHPLNQQLVINRHTVVGVKAAIEILQPFTQLSARRKKRIYWIIEQHDISYGLFREFKQYGTEPGFTTWEIINNNIHPEAGAGIIYLLLFKLADIHGHANIEDVIWFYNMVQQHYYAPIELTLPIPCEDDIRCRTTHEYQ